MNCSCGLVGVGCGAAAVNAAAATGLGHTRATRSTRQARVRANAIPTLSFQLATQDDFLLYDLRGTQNGRPLGIPHSMGAA